MSHISTAVLWYLSHLLLSVRSHQLHRVNVKQRLESDFRSISDLLEISVQETSAFLLDVISNLATDTSTLISYTAEVVNDSIMPLDILIMNRNEELKNERRKWEVEFDRIVVERQASVPGYEKVIHQATQSDGIPALFDNKVPGGD